MFIVFLLYYVDIVQENCIYRKHRLYLARIKLKRLLEKKSAHVPFNCVNFNLYQRTQAVINRFSLFLELYNALFEIISTKGHLKNVIDLVLSCTDLFLKQISTNQHVETQRKLKCAIYFKISTERSIASNSAIEQC